MTDIIALKPEVALPTPSCAVIDRTHGSFYVIGYVSTPTGGYIADWCPPPFEDYSAALAGAKEWAEQRGVDRIYTRFDIEACKANVDSMIAFQLALAAMG